MPTNKETGQEGEKLAADHLKRKGYTILATNWRSLPYELDIIAQIGDEIVFVEVKTRRSTSHGYPEKAVTMKKAKNLFEAATIYLEENDLENEIRFDIISITIQGSKTEIFHIEDGISPYPEF